MVRTLVRALISRIFLKKIYFLAVRQITIEDSAKGKDINASILQAKSIVLDEQIEKEIALQKKIKSVLPAKYSVALRIEDMNEAFRRSINLLRAFYEEVEISNDSPSSASIWKNLREMLRTIPNIFIFQAILKEMDQNNVALNEIISKYSEGITTHPPSQLILKASKLLITASVEGVAQKRKLRKIKPTCSESIQNLTNELEGIMVTDDSFQFDEDDDIVRDYVSVLIKYLMLQGKLDLGKAVAEELKTQIKEKEIAEYAAIVKETRNNYNIIDSIVLMAQQSIAQMYQINEKLNFGQISMTHLVQDLKASFKYQNVNRSMMNMTLSEGSSIPSYKSELQLFLDTPIEHFDFTSKRVAFELRKNHLLKDPELAPLFKHISGEIMYLKGFVDSMKKFFAMSEKMRPVLLHVEPKADFPEEFSTAELNKKRNMNREAISEVLDEITKTNVTSKSHLRLANVLVNYSLTNPFRKLIPATRKFEGRSYREYENEFNIYYNMIKD